ncbi:MAG: hypothetical protein ABJN84_06405 [Flavobacteriaceae bacterium]
MSVFTFHLAEISLRLALKRFFIKPNLDHVNGLIHAEYMTGMTLGAPLFSYKRILPRQVAIFAQWENESAIDLFLKKEKFGKILSNGWHCRLSYLRQWGRIDSFEIPIQSKVSNDVEKAVVAVTLARMKLFHVPRFIHWGRPVEKLVRDHPGTTFALAAIRLPRTVSTFSIWKSQKEMTNMVHGHSPVNKPKRHANAMKERKRKNFHYQFTTLRFKPIGEYGKWQGRTSIIPNIDSNKLK